MTDTPTRGHNMPPITAPTDAEFLADLQGRYPEIATKLDEFEKALASYPERLTLKDEAIAANLQDLLGQMKKQQTVWGAFKKSEKKPWDTVVKVVQNFFGKSEDKVDAWLDKYKPIYQQFLDLKEADNRRKAEEAAEAQRAEAKRLQDEADAAEARRLKAEEEAAAAVKREEEARAAAAAAEAEQRAAEERAAAAQAEERRLADAKRARDKAEREGNETALRGIKRHMKDAEKLHALCESDEASDEEVKNFDLLVQAGGVIGNLAGPVAQSLLLDDEQKAEIATVRARLGELRSAVNARHDAKERKRREVARKRAEAEEAAAAEARAAARRAEEEAAARVAEERRVAEVAALQAKGKVTEAKTEVRDARADHREAVSDAKGAVRDGKRLGADADRAENRADRLDRKVTESTDADFSRTRGDLGSVGGITGRWGYEVIDRDALLRTLGQLAAYLMEDAVDAAVYRWMRAHQGEFEGERVEGRLPGCVFMWVRDARISA